jgi:hypothetical protein
MKAIRISLLALVSGIAACSGSDDKVDIGDRNVAEIGSKLTDYAGAWDGYAEAYEFPSGSDRVRITLDGNGNGSVEFGDVPPLVMSTDPQIGFPPIDWETELLSISGLAQDAGAMPFREGFEYTVADSTLEERRFRFGVEMGEIIAPWCAMQTSYAQQGSGYLCAPEPRAYHPTCTVSEVQNGNPTQVAADCDWAAHCRFEHCACDASGCSANPELGAAKFDSTLENGGSDLVGTLSFPTVLPDGSLRAVTTRLTVRLTRNP